MGRPSAALTDDDEEQRWTCKKCGADVAASSQYARSVLMDDESRWRLFSGCTANVLSLPNTQRAQLREGAAVACGVRCRICGAVLGIRLLRCDPGTLGHFDNWLVFEEKDILLRPTRLSLLATHYQMLLRSDMDAGMFPDGYPLDPQLLAGMLARMARGGDPQVHECLRCLHVVDGMLGPALGSASSTRRSAGGWLSLLDALACIDPYAAALRQYIRTSAATRPRRGSHPFHANLLPYIAPRVDVNGTAIETVAPASPAVARPREEAATTPPSADSSAAWTPVAAAAAHPRRYSCSVVPPSLPPTSSRGSLGGVLGAECYTGTEADAAYPRRYSYSVLAPPARAATAAFSRVNDISSSSRDRRRSSSTATSQAHLGGASAAASSGLPLQSATTSGHPQRRVSYATAYSPPLPPPPQARATVIGALRSSGRATAGHHPRRFSYAVYSPPPAAPPPPTSSVGIAALTASQCSLAPPRRYSHSVLAPPMRGICENDTREMAAGTTTQHPRRFSYSALAQSMEATHVAACIPPDWDECPPAMELRGAYTRRRRVRSLLRLRESAPALPTDMDSLLASFRSGQPRPCSNIFRDVNVGRVSSLEPAHVPHPAHQCTLPEPPLADVSAGGSTDEGASSAATTASSGVENGFIEENGEEAPSSWARGGNWPANTWDDLRQLLRSVSPVASGDRSMTELDTDTDVALPRVNVR